MPRAILLLTFLLSVRKSKRMNNPRPVLKARSVSRPTQLQELIRNRILADGPTCDLNDINVSEMTSMLGLFKNLDFRGNISRWKTSNVTDMSEMFEGSSFNGDISGWDTSRCTSMRRMFKDSQFSGDLSKWNVRKVFSMSHMFEDSTFNGSVKNWIFEYILNIKSMFKNTPFSGDISSWTCLSRQYRGVTMAEAFVAPGFKSDLPFFSMNTDHEKSAALPPQYRGRLSDNYSLEDAAYLFESKPAFNQYLRERAKTGLERLHIEKAMTEAKPRWMPAETRQWLHLEKGMCESLGLGLTETRAHVYAQYVRRQQPEWETLANVASPLPDGF